MIEVKREGIILKPIPAAFEMRSVFNPGVWQNGNSVEILYRAVADDYVSTIGYARLEGPMTLVERLDYPLYRPEEKYESQGLEDPRIVKIDDSFLVTYVAHNGQDAISAYLYGDDLKNLKRGGLLSPEITYKEMPKIWRWTKLKDEYLMFQAFYQNFNGKNVLLWHKDLVPFPEKINGQFTFLERILPDIQLVSAESLDDFQDKYFWIRHLFHLDEQLVLEADYDFEARNIGGGAPPLKTADGWLMIYHGVEEKHDSRTYSAGVALLDLNDPRKVIARLPYPLLKPETDYEVSGQVNNVVFPTGLSLFDDRLYIYYGGADNCIAVASLVLSELLNELKKYPIANAYAQNK
ncbi:pesticidal protein Cry7Aa [Candidatus Falkowbacteria bacterium CG10_big_fil_rev_8_21_14_0_10_37_14]|uniref:Pesticidal protein Cry7Aa n=1 Tax=Candidatus Falkowbacteria bacterium CG10_big_fil_rev_8_21_14_0_10_37_14 TaxID=1974561 RepID=A0A2M6WUJ3_9BACT|nr:pesticidal protein Cry7Aa [Candidatus Falkowbacteria bacterium]PIT96386.1 MAG: pesticidal protein Cry7Aa [Candidatus Falkowbacteria bacterium CG10_big_fil_rev_8_21_14_0_10_37_14]